jgi:transposase
MYISAVQQIILIIIIILYMVKKQLSSDIKLHIVKLYDRKFSVDDIANIYETSKRTIYNILEKHKNYGTVERKDGSGKTQQFNIDKYITNLIKSNNTITISQICKK